VQGYGLTSGAGCAGGGEGGLFFVHVGQQCR
jgi:hypothetical protein